MKIFFLFFLNFLFFSIDCQAKWTEVIHESEDTKDRNKIMTALYHFRDTYTVKNITAISIGAPERPIITRFALKVFDIVWEDEDDCYFGGSDDRPMIKNYENGYIEFEFADGRKGSFTMGDGDAWKDKGNPCKKPPEKIFKEPKLKIRMP